MTSMEMDSLEGARTGAVGAEAGGAGAVGAGAARAAAGSVEVAHDEDALVAEDARGDGMRVEAARGDGAVVEASRPLSLEGAGNVRDLGGYPFSMPNGARGVTAHGAFLRGDALGNLTEGDVDELEGRGVATVVDLRGSIEEERSRDPFGEGSRHPEVCLVRVPLLDQMNSSDFMGRLPSDMFAVYRMILDRQARELGRVLEVLADAKGAALFHCSAGKDRTGVVAMLLLKLAGVPDDAVIADYAATEAYMRPRFEAQMAQLAQAGIEVPASMFGSKPEDMRRTLAHLRDAYGSAERYALEQAGCDASVVDGIRAKLSDRAGDAA